MSGLQFTLLHKYIEEKPAAILPRIGESAGVPQGAILPRIDESAGVPQGAILPRIGEIAGVPQGGVKKAISTVDVTPWFTVIIYGY